MQAFEHRVTHDLFYLTLQLASFVIVNTDQSATHNYM